MSKFQKFFGPKIFAGTLSKDKDEVKLKFEVAADISGKLELTLDRFRLDENTRFIKQHHYKGGTRFVEFSLRGIATDGARFECDDIIMTSLNEKMDDDGMSVCPVIHSSSAQIKNVESNFERPTIIWRLKRFECFHPLLAHCSLGKVELAGARELSGEDIITGILRVTAEVDPLDLDDWKVQANALCDHVRHVMSFALSVLLQSPVQEFADYTVVEMKFYSQTMAEKSENAAFRSTGLHEIFECAVRTFFDPPIEVKNLFFAIRWFTMRPHYAEAMLISSMTVLENLIDSNLSKDDVLLLSERQYERLRKKLSAVIKDEIKEWGIPTADQPELIQDLNNRLADLKRRSLIDKMELLSKRWHVQLEDIPSSEILQAKKVRDHVVHRGYYEPKPGEVADMHDHVLTVREIIVRFILTALGFQGSYWSYRGGYHSRMLQYSVASLENK